MLNGPSFNPDDPLRWREVLAHLQRLTEGRHNSDSAVMHGWAHPNRSEQPAKRNSKNAY
jgi:hypothetical protein